MSNGYFKENYNFPRFQRGSNIFQGGGVSKIFQGGGGPNANFYKTHITCDFPGGVRTPYPPVDPLVFIFAVYKIKFLATSPYYKHLIKKQFFVNNLNMIICLFFFSAKNGFLPSCTIITWNSTRENQSSGVCKQQRCRPACTSAVWSAHLLVAYWKVAPSKISQILLVFVAE